MNQNKLSETNKKYFEKLDNEEKRIRKTLLDDAGDFEELQSEWQERDSPAERNLREVEWNQYRLLQNELSEVVDAIQRIKDGGYGICENCELEISAKRLAAVPSARKCVACQEKMEKISGKAF